MCSEIKTKPGFRNLMLFSISKQAEIFDENDEGDEGDEGGIFGFITVVNLTEGKVCRLHALSGPNRTLGLN